MMSGDFRSFLEAFPRVEGVYDFGLSADLQAQSEQYLRLRRTEGRLYPDDIAASLPNIPRSHTLQSEWRCRADSARRLSAYIQAHVAESSVLEVGCGNGWLSRHLATTCASTVLGLDINREELVQAARLGRHHPSLSFACGDVFSSNFGTFRCDMIVVASSLQYFPDVRMLVSRLLSLLAAGGEIHILDSPLYLEHEREAARMRTRQYFAEHGEPSMADRYHHHGWSDLSSFSYRILYDPRSFLRRIERVLIPRSPFPWICIAK